MGAGSTIMQTLPAYRAHLSQRYAPKTRAMYVGDVRERAVYLTGRALEEIRPLDLEQRASTLTSPSGRLLERKTRYRKLSAVITYFTWLQALEVLTNVPTPALINARVQSLLPDCLYDSEIQTLYEVASLDPRTYLLVLLLPETGIKSQELLELTPANHPPAVGGAVCDRGQDLLDPAARGDRVSATFRPYAFVSGGLIKIVVGCEDGSSARGRARASHVRLVHQLQLGLDDDELAAVPRDGRWRPEGTPDARRRHTARKGKGDGEMDGEMEGDIAKQARALLARIEAFLDGEEVDGSTITDSAAGVDAIIRDAAALARQVADYAPRGPRGEPRPLPPQAWQQSPPPWKSEAPRPFGMRCEAPARKGTGTGTCGSLLDRHGLCPKAGSHLE
jgi:hypothetical protein